MLRVGRHHAYSTSPFHNGGKPNGGVLRRRRRDPVRAPGGRRAEDSTAVFHTARVRRGLDALSVVKSLGQRGWRPVYCPLGRREPGSRSSEDRHHGQRQTDVPAEQPPPREGARFPSPDADPRRSLDPGGSTPQRARTAHRLTCANEVAVRTLDVRRVFDEGRPVHGSRVVVFLAPGTGAAASSPVERSATRSSGTELGASFERRGWRSLRGSGTDTTPSSWPARPSGGPRRRTWWPR